MKIKTINQTLAQKTDKKHYRFNSTTRETKSDRDKKYNLVEDMMFRRLELEYDLEQLKKEVLLGD